MSRRFGLTLRRCRMWRFSTQNLFTCSQDSQERMKELIREHRLNRIVVSACTPKTHEGIFMETLEACGLNRYLFEMANIRNQDSWVHAGRSGMRHRKGKGSGSDGGCPGGYAEAAS